jgi:hypothetical protein
MGLQGHISLAPKEISIRDVLILFRAEGTPMFAILGLSSPPKPRVFDRVAKFTARFLLHYYLQKVLILIIIYDELRRDANPIYRSNKHTHCPFAILPHSFKRSRDGLWQIYRFPYAPNKQYALSISILFGIMCAWS